MPGAVAAQFSRVPNTTLTLPLEPPRQGFQLVDAFPGSYGFPFMVGIATAPGETNRLFVVRLTGQIGYLTNFSNPVTGTLLDISHKVAVVGEGGLTGLAFHPNFAENRQFFVFYTRSNYNHEPVGLYDQVSRFEVFAGDPTQADPDSEVSLIAQFDEHPTHQGGDLRFGPDGYLYVTLGDEGGGGDRVYQNSQRIDKDYFSGILRLDVDMRPGNLPPNPHPASQGNYLVPADNPYVGATSFNTLPVDPDQVRTEFWAVGLRNPFRITFDPADGTLYCGDVGEASREEVNIIVKGGNYGWNFFEGNLAFANRASAPPAGVDFIPPIYEYGRASSGWTDPMFAGQCVIGGIVYRGLRFSQLHGFYVFGDIVSQHVWALRYESGAVGEVVRLATSPTLFATLGRDPSNGDVLIPRFTGLQGRIARLVYDDTPVGDPIPELLSETGAFADLGTLEVNAGIVPYEINHPFWSDHAVKRRWFSVPDPEATIGYAATAPWAFPSGTVWIKHFELELERGNPATRRRLETRFLVKNDDGMYGVTYRWNEAQDEADLVPEAGMEEEFEVMENGQLRSQVWRYPARSECLTCHNAVGGHALGFNTQQLNRLMDYGDGETEQLLALGTAGYFSNPPTTVSGLPKLAALEDTTAHVEQRVRSYLDANCAYCHQPGGSGRGEWDGRFTTPLGFAGIVDGMVVDGLGIEGARVVKPGRPDLSVLLERISRWEGIHMPPLATSVLHQEAIDLVAQWAADGSFVMGRHVFYNRSAWDGNGSEADAGDDGAVAPDKVALLPGGRAGFANYTSYSRGLNGIMVDVLNLPGDPLPEDFQFRWGNNHTPSGWAFASGPSQIAVRRGDGVLGSDRVSLVWPDGEISRRWLQVRVLPTARTGLGSEDVFYFGNAIGESGNSATDAHVDPVDELLARANPKNVFDPAPIDFPYDYNRDGHVDAADQLIARSQRTTVFDALRLIDLEGHDGAWGFAATASAGLLGGEGERRRLPRLRVGGRIGDRLVLVLEPVSNGNWQLEMRDRTKGGQWRRWNGAVARKHDGGGAWLWDVPVESGVANRFWRVVPVERE